MTHPWRVFLFFLFLLPSAQAQEAMLNASYEYGLELGNFLPNQMAGMEEIMPLWAVHYAFRWGPGLLDSSMMNANAHGSSYSNLNFGYRWEWEVDSLLWYMGLGATAHYFTQKNSTSRTLYGGGYAQTGAMLPLSTSTFLDTNFRFFVNPGTALYFSIGILFRF